METKNIIYIVIGVAVIIIAAVLLTGKNPFQNAPPGQNNQQGETDFSRDGILVKNLPGMKADTWYLAYDQSGTVTKELDMSGVSQTNLQSGQRAIVIGKEKDNVVRVTELRMVNAFKDDLIWAMTPLPDQVITSPLVVTGQARGNWYFEASFPVTLLDANGKVLAQVPAQAQGEWMVTTYVPFSVTLTFAKPTTATGTLVLQKDNPSGLPQNANELRIPVKFDIGQ